jgi:hypothetical protein
MKLLNKDEAFIEYCLYLALTRIPEISGNLDPISQFVQVRIALAARASDVVSVGNIDYYQYMIQQIATGSNKGDRPNE